MPTKTRAELKSHFVKNAIPTEIDFADLLDSQLNQQDDGVFKPRNEALGVRAAGDQRRVLRLYSMEAATNPDWMLALNPLQDPNNPASARAGFGITDAAGVARLFIEAGSGRVGIGTNAPQASLDVTGEIRANGLRGQNSETLDDYRTVNLKSNVYLHSPGNDTDAWIYRDSADPNSNWGIYHRQIDTSIEGLPANSIGFIGGGSKLRAWVSLWNGDAYFAGSLESAGAIRANGLRGQNTIELKDYRNLNLTSNVCLHSPPGDRDAWIYLDSADPNANYGIYHRQLDAGPVGEGPVQLPVNSIGFIGGGSSKLLAYVCLGDGSTFFSGPMTLGGELSLGGKISAVRHPEGKLLFRMHSDSDRKFEFFDTAGTRTLMAISGTTGDVRISEGDLSIVKGGLTICRDLTVSVAGRIRMLIDDPLGPSKYAEHSVIIGPEESVLLWGEGEIVEGECTIQLPKGFEKQTRSEAHAVLVTPIWSGTGTSAMAATAVAGGRFTVHAIDARLNKQKFYWQVKSVRRPS